MGGFHGQGAFAGMMIEEKPAQFKRFEVRGVSNQFYGFVIQKIVTVPPAAATAACFEAIAVFGFQFYFLLMMTIN